MERSLKTFHELWTAIGDVDVPDGDWNQTIRADSVRGTVPPLPPMTVDQGMDTDADLQVTRVIGEGGMGTVFLANQRSLEREVAIKQLKPGASDAHRAGLLREGRFMGTLEHPNIVPVHALGLDQEGLPTLVMKRIEGTSWDTLLRGKADWDDYGTWPSDPISRSVLVLIEVCKAVQFAHARGVVHRDLKPANVMIGRLGEVYVVDWGIACRWERRTDAGSLVGTPAYIAPEMVDPTGPIDPRTDVYLLGGCLHEVLTGRPPHSGRDLQTVLQRAHASPPPNLSGVPGELAELCCAALSARPEDRPDGAGTFRSALAAFLQHRSANRLAFEADARVDQIAALPDDAEPSAALALFREAEFAYRQALVEWPESPRARDGLRDLLARRVAWKLDREDPEGASADLDLARDLGAELDEALATRVRDAVHYWKTLRSKARQEDLRVLYRGRRLYVLAVLGGMAALGLLQSERLMSPFVPYGAGWLAALGVGFGTLTSAATWAFRRRAFSDRASRRILQVMYVNGGVVIAHRTWGWLAGLESWEVLGGDMFLAAVVCLLIAVFIRRAVWRWAVVALIGGFLTAMLPSWAGEIYVGCTVAILALMLATDHTDDLD